MAKKKVNCPKCDREVIDVRTYPKWDREGKKSAKLYVHSRNILRGPIPMADITDSCLVVKEKRNEKKD